MVSRSWLFHRVQKWRHDIYQNDTLENGIQRLKTLGRMTIEKTVLIPIATMLRKMTLSKMTLSKMTLSKMTLSQMTLSKMTLSKMTISKMTISKMTLSKMTLSKMTLSKMTISDRTLSGMTGIIIQFRKMTVRLQLLKRTTLTIMLSRMTVQQQSIEWY